MPRWANRRTQEMGKTKNGHQGVRFLFDAGVPTGIRTPVTAVKGRCPRPLDDGDLVFLVEVSGIEPLTSCMPCKRSPS